jgi:hypothetical protein
MSEQAMAAKVGPTNQCEVLHPIYGFDNCCLCNARQELNNLKLDIGFLIRDYESYLEAYTNAYIRLVDLQRKGVKVTAGKVYEANIKRCTYANFVRKLRRLIDEK